MLLSKVPETVREADNDWKQRAKFTFVMFDMCDSF